MLLSCVCHVFVMCIYSSVMGLNFSIVISDS